jgi:hypothetical protein
MVTKTGPLAEGTKLVLSYQTVAQGGAQVLGTK